MENAPPIAIFLRPDLQRFVPPFEPSVGHRGKRRREIRANGATRQTHEQCCGEPPAQSDDSAAPATPPFGLASFAPGKLRAPGGCQSQRITRNEEATQGNAGNGPPSDSVEQHQPSCWLTRGANAPPGSLESATHAVVAQHGT